MTPQRFIGIQALKGRLDKGRAEQPLVIEKGNKQRFIISSLPGALNALSKGPASPPGGRFPNFFSSTPVQTAPSSSPSPPPSPSVSDTDTEAAPNKTSKDSVSATRAIPGALLSEPKTAAAYSKAVEMMKESEEKKASKKSSSSSSSSSSGSISSQQSSSPVKLTNTYLEGLPGDFGFDPLGIYDPKNYGTGVMDPSWLQYSEVYHSRWAMLGVVGCLVPEARGDHISWFKTGFLPYLTLTAEEKEATSFWLNPYQLFSVQVVLMGWVEYIRIRDYWEPRCKLPSDTPPDAEEWLEEALSSCATGDPIYPGGPLFNPTQLLRDKSSNLSEFKESEVIAGRVAMVAFLGFIVQGLAMGGEVGPYQNLQSHLENPFGENVVTLLVEKNAMASKLVGQMSDGLGGVSRMELGSSRDSLLASLDQGVTMMAYQERLLND